MLTADDVRVLDLNSASHGVPPSVLMQNAGHAVFEEAQRFRPRRAVVLCGLGNNGGDGAVAARLLAESGVAVTVLYAGDPTRIRSGEARLAYEVLDRRRVRIESHRSPERTRTLLRGADLVIDAILGVGVTGDLREPIKSLVRLVNSSRRPTLCVDVPTGLGGRLQVQPQTTITLHDRKRGMKPANSGKIRVVDIGIPPAAQNEIGPGDLAVYYPRPDADSHKGENGRLLAVLGGPYTGAPILASLAAMRTGCDLVRLHAPGEAARAAQAHSPDLIVHTGVDERRLVPDDVEAIVHALERSDALLMGCGLGTDRPTQKAIEDILLATQRRRTPLVLDADALAVAGRRPELLHGRPVLCTPHAAEYQRLAGASAPRGADAGPLEKTAKRLRATILLKVPTAILSDGRRTKLGRVHPRGFTAGGVGDVLAGSSAALVAKGLDPFRAGAAASFLVGAAARRAVHEHGHGARATDVVGEIGHVLREWLPARSA